MNRIIILGNGFDLSHQLPTSYSDFLLYCHTHDLKRVGEELHNKFVRIIDCKILTIEHAISNNKFDLLKRHIYEKSTVYYKNNEFFEEICKIQAERNWVDIEQEYFNQLLKVVEGVDTELLNGNMAFVNEGFLNVLNALNEYIYHVVSNYELSFVDEYFELFTSNLKYNHYYSVFDNHRNYKDGQAKETLFVNFNYTQTVQQYTKMMTGLNPLIINIHGQVNDPKNPIIFGYGDETNDHYQQIENTNDNEFLKYFKSFQYALNSNYQDITRFINADIYEVFVIGHSCGLSDRILLRDIFTADNCKNIMISYYQDQNNFLDIYRNMSRLFTDKAMLRQRIMPFDESVECPQLKRVKKYI